MRILVVEDQDSIRRMIEALVQARGHQVTAVSSGAKAIDVALTETPDIVLLDLNLPGQYDGFDVCQRLRADATTHGVNRGRAPPPRARPPTTRNRSARSRS